MKKRLAGLALAGSLVAPTAHADLSDVFSLYGFGTVGFTKMDHDEGNFVAHADQPSGSGPYSEQHWGYKVDSKLGLQLNAQFTDELSAVGQTVIQNQWDDEIRPGLEWAYLKYQVTPGLALRAGRFASPGFYYSESRNVGYSYLWVRPPVEVYGVTGSSSQNGVDALYNTRLFGTPLSLQASYGKETYTVPGNAEVELDQSLTLSGRLDFSPVEVRLAVVGLEVSSDPNGFENLKNFGPQGEELYDEYGLEDTRTVYGNLSVVYDEANIVAQGEVIALRLEDSFSADTTAGYLSLGYRMGAFTPYVVGAAIDTKTKDEITELTGMGAQAEGYQRVLNGIIASQNSSQTSITLGTRWDFAPTAALKIQAKHVMPDSDSYSTLAGVDPQVLAGTTAASDGGVSEPVDDYNVFSATVDFLF